MATIPVTFRFSVETDNLARELQKACQDVAEIIELVPEWNMNDCEQISERLLKRFKKLLILKPK